MVGMGPDYNEVIKLADKLNISENLNMLGYIYDTAVLDCLYSISDLFIFPSIYDTSGLVVREAAAMETVSLVVENTGASECIKNMENGIKVADNADCIAKAIKDFLALDEECRSKMGICAKETIALPWDGKIMDNVLNRYQLAIDNYKAK